MTPPPPPPIPPPTRCPLTALHLWRGSPNSPLTPYLCVLTAVDRPVERVTKLSSDSLHVCVDSFRPVDGSPNSPLTPYLCVLTAVDRPVERLTKLSSDSLHVCVDSFRPVDGSPNGPLTPYLCVLTALDLRRGSPNGPLTPLPVCVDRCEACGGQQERCTDQTTAAQGQRSPTEGPVLLHLQRLPHPHQPVPIPP